MEAQESYQYSIVSDDLLEELAEKVNKEAAHYDAHPVGGVSEVKDGKKSVVCQAMTRR